MRRSAERGVALVGALGALAALTLVATGVATTAVREARRSHDRVRQAQADALVRSGVRTAAVLLADWTALGPTDTLHAPWAGDGTTTALGPGRVTVTVEDAARRLDLADPGGMAALPGLLRALQLDAAPADAVADWADADLLPRPHGAERSAYRGLVPARVPADAPPGSVGELALVRDMPAATLARLRPFVTAHGEARVNPNTAPLPVLTAWLGDPARAQALVQQRRAATIPCDDLPRCTLRSTHFVVRAVADVGGLRRGAEATVRVLGDRPAVVAWWPLPDDDPALGRHARGAT